MSVKETVRKKPRQTNRPIFGNAHKDPNVLVLSADTWFPWATASLDLHSLSQNECVLAALRRPSGRGGEGGQTATRQDVVITTTISKP
jgi:hypothetical protein